MKSFPAKMLQNMLRKSYSIFMRNPVLIMDSSLSWLSAQVEIRTSEQHLQTLILAKAKAVKLVLSLDMGIFGQSVTIR